MPCVRIVFPRVFHVGTTPYNSDMGMSFWPETHRQKFNTYDTYHNAHVRVLSASLAACSALHYTWESSTSNVLPPAMVGSKKEKAAVVCDVTTTGVGVPARCVMVTT